MSKKTDNSFLDTISRSRARTKTVGDLSVLHSTVAGVEIRITSSNRFYCTYNGRTAFPYFAGSSELKFDLSGFALPQEAAEKIKQLLTKQIQVRMSPGYRQDLEDENNKELWEYTNE